jgi:hypothetical protein
MAPVAIWFGSLMVLLGGGLYGASVVRGILWHDETVQAVMVRTLTALIPAGFGLVLIVLGLLAKNGSDKMRMHTMHVAALLGLLGVALPLWRVIKAVTGDGPLDPLPVGGNVIMMLLSGVFLFLCVKSFIEVRKARKAREALGAAPIH